MRSRIFVLLFAGFSALTAAFALFPATFPGSEIIIQKVRGQATVSDRVAEYGPSASARWKPYFERAGIEYPPRQLLFLGLKQEKRLEIYAKSGAEKHATWKFVRALPILRASGHSGPKLHEGDLQVPEGFYKIEGLNPNSAFHLSLRINYPNSFDRENAARDGRADLGSDIMIHGSKASIGCLAMGDVAAEDLFVLAAQTGIENIEVWLCPLDFRRARVLTPQTSSPVWLSALYDHLAAAVRLLPVPKP